MCSLFVLCVQTVRASRASTNSDKTFVPLHTNVAGWHQPYTVPAIMSFTIPNR